MNTVIKIFITFMVSDILHMAGLNECSLNVAGANITFMVDYYING